MNVIYKYLLEPAKTKYELPKGAHFLCVQAQRGEPQMWFIVDRNETRKETREFVVYGTGHGILEPLVTLDYLGTFQIANGDLVFHVFEEISNKIKL